MTVAGGQPWHPSLGLGGLAGTVLDGRYHIDQKVAEGGSSLVFRAVDLTDGTWCALKVLSSVLPAGESHDARLRWEARVGLRLEHPNICPIHRLGETPDGLIYVVMPFLDGELLSDRTHRSGHLQLDQVARYVRDIAAALEAAHRQGVVHRDLKPENVMIVRDLLAPEWERCVVLDFGMSREHAGGPDGELTATDGTVAGTPEFVSPEQLRGEPPDGRADQYSLALMAFEMLTGMLPFAGDTRHDVLLARLRSEPKLLRHARAELDFPPALEQVLQRAMARSADRRFPGIREFADRFAEAAVLGQE